MDKNTIIIQSTEFVKDKLKNDSSGHDWWHIYRVLTLARRLHKTEGGDLFIIELAALLHDVADWKFYSNENSGLKIVSDWLETQHVNSEVINSVLYIIEHISYKGEGEIYEMKTIEGKIVQDADRLDAIGAIGIARTFAFGGYKGNEMHNPNLKPLANMTFEEYKKTNGTTINHFYEKLLLLKDRMNTKTAKELADSRHEFMQRYLEKFYSEWEGIE
ncbi:MAG: HD domain-containing protein [Bacteroidales bacterium]